MRAAILLVLSGCFLLGERDPLVRGRVAIKEQRFADANRELASVPTTHPRYQEAQFLLGTLALVSGTEQAALAQIVAARALAPDRFDEEHEWRKILAALSGKRATRWTIKVTETPRSIATADGTSFVVSQRGMVTAVAADHHVLWEHDLGARGGSARTTVAVAGGRVFAIEHAHSRAKLVALDAQTGEPAWSHEIGRAEPEQNPLVAAGAVYVGLGVDGQHGQWQAFRVDGGAPLWTAPLDHPPGAAVIAGGKLCGIVRASITCVEAASGAAAWHYDGFEHAPNGMAIVAGAGSRLYATSNGTLYGFDVSRPGLGWKVRIAPATISAPVIDADGSLVVETSDAIAAYDADTGTKRWIVHHDPVNPPALDGRPLVRLAGLWVGWTNDRVFAIDDHHALVFDALVGGSVAAPPIASTSGELVVGIAGQQTGVVGLVVEPWGRPGAEASR
jgi:outer membrane protein assembly factor BamB